jgi:hypothetical protein
LPLSHLSDHRDVDQNFIASRRVATSQGATKLIRSPPQAAKKFVEPSPRVRLWQGEAQEETPRSAPHGRYITYGAGQALPADCIWGVLVFQEVGAFQEPVACQDRFPANPEGKKRCIVSHTQSESVALSGLLSPRAPRNPLQQGVFVLVQSSHPAN